MGRMELGNKSGPFWFNFLTLPFFISPTGTITLIFESSRAYKRWNSGKAGWSSWWSWQWWWLLLGNAHRSKITECLGMLSREQWLGFCHRDLKAESQGRRKANCKQFRRWLHYQAKLTEWKNSDRNKCHKTDRWFTVMNKVKEMIVSLASW